MHKQFVVWSQNLLQTGRSNAHVGDAIQPSAAEERGLVPETVRGGGYSSLVIVQV